MGPDDLREAAEGQLIRKIPEIFDALQELSHQLAIPTVIVLCHDQGPTAKYEFRTRNGRTWQHPSNQGISPRALMKPLWQPYLEAYGPKKSPPSFFVAFDLVRRRVWFRRNFAAIRSVGPRDKIPVGRIRKHPPAQAQNLLIDTPQTTPTKDRRYDNSDLDPIVREPVEMPPAIDTTSRRVRPKRLATSLETIGPPSDRPEEMFLIGEDLLRLAADSLDGADLLDPLPVHLNALWVFSRPVVLMRPDGKTGQIHAVWFRQGRAVWRIRAFTAKSRGSRSLAFHPNGGELAGRIPFVPQWDPGHPEQKFLVAIWALMQQGDVTETHQAAERHGTTPGEVHEPDDLHVVQLRTGSEHARMYRGRDQGLIARSAWSVRGHWRRQPYRSLGLDENGKPLTKLIWIASYVKGDPAQMPSTPKVIDVR